MIKKIITTAVITGSLLIGASNMAKAQDIEIKGFKLGMTKKEAKANVKNVRIKSKWLNAKLIPHYYMTLAGVHTETPRLFYDKKNKAEGKPVLELAWTFCYSGNEFCKMQGDQHTPTTFAVVVEALKTKYPLECRTSTLQNGFGATFEQRICSYKKNGVVLETTRYDHSGLMEEMGIIRMFADTGESKVKLDDL